MIATDDDRQQATRLLKIHKRNLARLEEQRAKLAGSVNLGIDNQIDEERANIAALEPIANPPPQPSSKIQEFVKQTSPGDIDLLMLYLQGTQINARVTVQEEQTKKIVEEQSRASVWRMQTKELIDTLVAQVTTTESARQHGAKWYRWGILLLFVLVAILYVWR